MDLLPVSRQEPTLAQRTMSWAPLVRLYESQWLRRSPIVGALTRITFDQEYATIVSAAKLTGTEIVLDLACGTGIYARPLAHQLSGGFVVGLDLSLPMLTYASQRLRSEGLDNLLLIHADAMALPFADSAFDVVNCCGAVHLFVDLERALGEVARTLKSGGRFTIATFRKRSGRLAEQVVHLRKNVSGMNAFRPDELENLFNQKGLVNVECHHARGIWLIMSATRSTQFAAPAH